MKYRRMKKIPWFCLLLLYIMNVVTCQVVVHTETLGKTTWGEWGDEITCPAGINVVGFRLQVEEKLGFMEDDTALNGIQLECGNGDDTHEIEGPFGEWYDWVSCRDRKYITGFNFRSEPAQGIFDDDFAGVNVKMQCNDGEELDGDGLERGSWDSDTYLTCPTSTYFCGVQAQIEHDAVADHTALNRMKFLCCRKVDSTWRAWSSWTACSASCGKGTRSRSRVCSSTRRAHQILPCLGTNGTRTQHEVQIKTCTGFCGGNGNWGPWSPWERCTHTCGEGLRKRKRSCNSPPPTSSGLSCMTLNGVRSSTEFVNEPCNLRGCTVCPREEGFCVHANGTDQNSGVITLNNEDGDSDDAQEKCLKLCKAQRGVTGCEVIWDQTNRGCYAHTESIVRGNGAPKHYCWVFSKCSDVSRCDLMRCTSEYQPVCGTDGKTYKNMCFLKIASCKDSTIELANAGICDGGGGRCEMMCTEQYQPVCGTDGVTYGNKCKMKIATCTNSSITMAHDGECGGVSRCDAIMCIGNYRPVCGSDGRTYHNMCLLRIASCKNSTIKYVRTGICGGGVACKMLCSTQHQPVCGSNGVTYVNHCKLRLAACKDSEIKLAYKGECGGLGLTKCRIESNVEKPLAIGKFVPRCTLEGLYEVLQCHGSTGYCWCAEQYTGEKITETAIGPGEGKLTLAKCIIAIHKALVGVWVVSSAKGISETHRITADGIVSINGDMNRVQRQVKLAPSNNLRDFPTSKGWLMIMGLHGQLTSQYLRWREDDTIEIHHFCLKNCDEVKNFCRSECNAKYNVNNYYCCAGEGVKKLTKGATRRGKDGAFSFSVHLEVLEGDIKHYDIIVTELGDAPNFPRDNPHSYTNDDIKNNVDGLYVAGRITDETSFGKEFVVGGSSRRIRRALANPENRPLRKDSYYGVFVRGYITEDEFTTSTWYPAAKASAAGQDGSWKTAIAIVVVVILVIIINVLVIIHCLKRRKNAPKTTTNNSTASTNQTYNPDDLPIGEHAAHISPPSLQTQEKVGAGGGAPQNEKPGIPDEGKYQYITRVTPNVYETAHDPKYNYARPDSDQMQKNEDGTVRASPTEDESWKVRPRPRPSRKRAKEGSSEHSDAPNTSPVNPFTPPLYEPSYQDPAMQHPVNPFSDPSNPEGFYHEIGTLAVTYNVPSGVTLIPSTPPPDYSELHNTVVPKPINAQAPGYNTLDINTMTSRDAHGKPGYSELHNTGTPQPLSNPAPGYNRLDNKTMTSHHAVGKEDSLQPYEQLPLRNYDAVKLNDPPGPSPPPSYINNSIVEPPRTSNYDNTHYLVPRNHENIPTAGAEQSANNNTYFEIKTQEDNYDSVA